MALVDPVLVVIVDGSRKLGLMGHDDGSGLALGARQSKLGPFGNATSLILHTLR